MKNIFSFAFPALLFAASGLAGTLAFTPSGFSDSVSPYADTTGWSFTTSKTIQITALDYYDPAATPLLSAHQIGIWTSNGTLLTSATVPSGAPTAEDGSYDSVLITPLTLQAGSYVIGATNSSRSDAYVLNVTSAATISGVTYTGGGLISFASGLEFPVPIGNNAQPQFLSADFEVGSGGVASTPEPATWSILCAGLFAIALRRILPRSGRTAVRLCTIRKTDVEL